jgi:quercetin dioxygenase-like cupin family protein
MRKVIVILTLAAAAVVTAIALATPASTPPVLVAETARGTFDVLPKFNTKFANGGKVKLKAQGPVELITQKITAQPGATFGWHNHPGENFNVIWQGTLTLYHDEACASGIEYGPGSAFSTHPQDIHLAKNNGTVDVVFFATYLAPRTTPPTAVRVDQLLPAAGCPQ